VRSALFVHLLTEDNLPYYTNTILTQTTPNHPLNEWTRRWTAEEGRHSMAIRDWVLATRAFDPKTLEQGRMVQMAGGQVPQPDSLEDLLAYTSFQELATRVAHSNTGKQLGRERGGAQVMARVAGDEQLHYMFYRDVATAAIEVDPSTMVIAICKQLRHFDMPGTGIPDFERHKQAIARAGIFDGGQFLHTVVEPTLAHWQLDKVKGLNGEAEQARERIFRHVKVLGRAAAAQATRFATT
jgi:acyl-[acyl-carrier-protein] desaturase